MNFSKVSGTEPVWFSGDCYIRTEIKDWEMLLNIHETCKNREGGSHMKQARLIASIRVVVIIP